MDEIYNGVTTTMEPETAIDMAQTIGPEEVKRFTRILQKYKAGKAITEQRIVASEEWWKLHNASAERLDSDIMSKDGFKSASGWLHNVIVSKHADAMASFPEPVVRPREKGDKEEAHILSQVLPCVLKQVGFRKTYSAVQWQKLKTGTGVYKIVWDSSKQGGLGDISIVRCNLLNLYWEPGVENIQDSRFLFHTELVDKDVLEEMYPQLQGKLNGRSLLSTRFRYDDSIDTSGKRTVVDCYYHRYAGGKKILHYCKFVEGNVIFASENEPQYAQTGWYEHGKYPYVFDTLFPIEGSPCGFGFVDLCRNPQMAIDLLNTSFIRNAMVGSVPRYFIRNDASVNEEEFLDLTKALVHTDGTLGEDSLRQIAFNTLDSIYVNLQDRIIQELRETSGNTETSTGNISSGVTAASAIAALQEASGKGSKDSSLTSWDAFEEVVETCIEYFRQFYDAPRWFRVIGANGAEEFISYTNKHLVQQKQMDEYGQDTGYRLPVFDLEISAQKQDMYTRVSQNELALQFYGLGFFNPQNVDQALATIDMMDFDDKDEVQQKIQANGTMFQRLVQYQQLALSLAKKFAPELVQGLSQDIMQTMGETPAMAGGAGLIQNTGVEHENSRVNNARERSRSASQPTGGRVTKEAS